MFVDLTIMVVVNYLIWTLILSD